MYEFPSFPSPQLLYPFLFQRADVLTTGAGVPVGDKLNIQTAGPRGPLLVQDVVFTDEMAHFDRERIPERVVHAKGAGLCLRTLEYKFTNQCGDVCAFKDLPSLCFFSEGIPVFHQEN